MSCDTSRTNGKGNWFNRIWKINQKILKYSCGKAGSGRASVSQQFAVAIILHHQPLRCQSYHIFVAPTTLRNFSIFIALLHKLTVSAFHSSHSCIISFVYAWLTYLFMLRGLLKELLHVHLAYKQEKACRNILDDASYQSILSHVEVVGKTNLLNNPELEGPALLWAFRKIRHMDKAASSKFLRRSLCFV